MGFPSPPHIQYIVWNMEAEMSVYLVNIFIIYSTNAAVYSIEPSWAFILNIHL